MDECLPFIQRASGKPEVSVCGGPRATLCLVEDAFVVLRPGTGLEFETLAVMYVIRPWTSAPFSMSLYLHSRDGPPALPAMLGCPKAQGGWQSRNDLEKDKVHRLFVNGVCVQADPAQVQSGRDCGAVHVACFPFQISLNIVMMLFIMKSKTM